jgi:hypothetical protein
VEAGYWLRADATGHGYATEATAALAELAFAQLWARASWCVTTPRPGERRRAAPARFPVLGDGARRDASRRQAANGSVRTGTTVWVLDAPPTAAAG